MMENENPHSELMRLRKAQSNAQQNEVFGGLSNQERSEYNDRTERIHELSAQLQLTTDTDRDAAEQRREWNKESETDTPQSEGRQPYRTREQDSKKTVTDSLKIKHKNNAKEGRD